MLSFFVFLKKAAVAWRKDHAPYLAAAVAYHAIFSLSPLLIVILSIVGIFYNTAATQEEVQHAFQAMLGRDSAELIQNMLQGGKIAAQSKFALAIGTALTFLGSIGVFGQLQQAVHLIWQVQTPKLTIARFLKRQFLLFGLVIGTSILLVVSLVSGAVISAWSERLGSILSSSGWLLTVIQGVVSFGITYALFAFLLYALPAAKLHWRAVWLPALITNILFTIGKSALAFYLGHGSATSIYGAAGSFAGLLIWIFYVAQIFLFGVELVKVREETKS